MGALDSVALRRHLQTGEWSEKEIAYFPPYLRREMKVSAGLFKKALFWLLQVPVHALIWLCLRPRLQTPGELLPEEVEAVYERQAHRYDATHHFTTRGQDTHWRRWIGWRIALRKEKPVRVLDLCTGTGLTTVEILRVAKLTGAQVELVGVDYSEGMLKVARSRRLPENVSFVRGDATALIKQPNQSFATLEKDSFDVVSQMFGIGGISDPVSVFDEVLQVLKEGGEYILVDMHQPISESPGEWPLLGKWLKTPEFEMYTYLHTTIPLALARLWAWRETTLDFYLAPLSAHQADGSWWGFEIVERTVESERWWLGLPVMPTCKLVLRKVRITPEERAFRLRIRHMLTA